MVRRIKHLLLAGLLFVSQILVTIAAVPGRVSAIAYPNLVRVSEAVGGTPANNSSVNPVLSASGGQVVFVSPATNLIADDTNGVDDVFVRDLAAGATERVSVTSSEQQLITSSFGFRPSISGDGQLVSFESRARVLTGLSFDDERVFIRDRTAGTTFQASTASDGTPANASTTESRLSANGKWITFYSDATNLVTPDTNSVRESFLKNLTTGQVERIAVGANDEEPNGGSRVVDISSDGRFILFTSTATNLVLGDSNGLQDLFIRDRTAGTTERLVPPDCSIGRTYGGGQISDDGHWLVLNPQPCTGGGPQDGLVVLVDRQTNSSQLIPGLGSVVDMSGDGHYILFSYPGGNLYRYDRTTGSGQSFAFATSGSSRISSSGNSVGFVTTDTFSQYPGDTNGVQDVFVRQFAAEDSVSPSVSGLPDRQFDFGDWYNADVTIDWQANDPEPSSGAPTDPLDTVASLEGEHEYTSDQSCDPAGNCATGSLTLKIDKSEPIVSNPMWSTNPQTEGSDTTLTVDASDVISGVLGGEYFIGTDPGEGSGTVMTLGGGTLSATLGAGLEPGIYSIGVRVRDNAGNWSDVATTELEIIYDDDTPPVISYLLDDEPNSNGWFNSPVTLAWTVEDNESPVTDQQGCDEVMINQDGENTYTCTATSTGGTASDEVMIKYDATQPALSSFNVGCVEILSNCVMFRLISATRTFSVQAADSLSGIDRGEFYIDTDPGKGNGTTMTANGSTYAGTVGADTPLFGAHTLYVRTQDKAGNWSTPVSHGFFIGLL